MISVSSNMIRVFLTAFTCLFTLPFFASAYNIATPYWCGWGWSSAPCVTYPAQYYSYPSYSYNTNYPCVPVSWDSRGVVVQTSCGYSQVSYPHYNQYSYSYYTHPQSQYQWGGYDRYDRHDWSHDYNHHHDYRDRDHH